ncbi:MAG: hypothetical protein QM820_23480 [Minicystis sp.]
MPLEPEALQITVLGDRGSDDSVRTVLREVLADTDGETNWLSDSERSRKLGEGIGRMLTIAAGLALVVWVVRTLRS